MKKYLVPLFLLIFASQVNAQVNFGVRAGLISNDFNFTNLSDQIDDIKSESNEYGYHVGVALRVGKKYLLEIDPSIANYNAEYEINFNTPVLDNLKSVKAKQNQYVLDVPVLIGARFAGFLDVMAGPKFTLELSNKISYDSIKDKIGQDYRSATVGYQVGAGVKISKLMIDVRYNSTFSSITDGITIGDNFYNANVQPRSVIGSLTLFL
jgi:hypothetical protein